VWTVSNQSINQLINQLIIAFIGEITQRQFIITRCSPNLTQRFTSAQPVCHLLICLRVRKVKVQSRMVLKTITWTLY